MVLLTDIPSELLFTEKLSEFYDPLATKPMHVQIHRDLAKLATAIRKRDALLLQLEISLTKHIKRTARAYQRGGDLPQTRERIWRPVCRWMPAIPFIGHRDDKIDHLEREVAAMNRWIQMEQKELKGCPETTSAILQFEDRHTAEPVSRSIGFPAPHCMMAHHIDSTPSNILWKNFGLTWWKRRLRVALTTVVAIFSLLGWTLPIAFSGLLSQLQYLSGLLPWLGFLNQLPQWLIGAVQGVLPQTMTAILMLAFPLLVRILVEQQGLFDKVRVELRVQGYYFAFLFLQLFLTVSVPSGLAPVVAELMANPRSVSTILAQNLPKASNYFLSYIPLQAFTTAVIILDFGAPVCSRN